MVKHLYTVLDIEDESINAEGVRKAYRKKALAKHPDKNPGDKNAEAQFKEIVAAYDILGNEAKRKQYDAGKIDEKGVEIPQANHNNYEENEKEQEPEFNRQASPQQTAPSYCESEFQEPQVSEQHSFFEPEPRVFFAFFAKQEDIFKPFGLDDNQFFAYVTPAPLFDVFKAFNTFAENENATKSSRQTKDPFTAAHHEKTADRPTHVFAQAKSFNHMERMIDNLIANLLIIELMTNLTQIAQLAQPRFAPV